VDQGLFERHPIFPALPPFSPLNPTAAPAFSFPGIENRQLTGTNILGRWTHEITEDSNWQFQMYYDKFLLDQSLITADINTLDLDFTHEFPLADRHQLIYGVGYRMQDAVIGPSSYVEFGVPASFDGFQLTPVPPHLNLDQFSAFAQDEITLVEDQWYFTAGCKVENNPFVDWIAQPTGRILWLPSERQAWWASVSAPLRTPSFSSASTN
jgi:iron complex outermembrane receptor protein